MARNIIARFIPVFPANAIGAGGIKVEKSGGAFTISTDFDQFSSQEGSILYRGATAWQALPRGQDGQVLQSTANSIQWSTSAADQTFVGVQPIVVNTVGSTTTTSWNGDYFSATQGALIKRGATAYEGLDKGTPGQVLTVNPGGTDIEWADATAASGERNIVDCGVAGGTADALVLTPTTPITSYEQNVLYRFTVPTANTGAMTANISGVGVTTMQINRQAIVGNMVVPNVVHYLSYDGTNFQTWPAEPAPISVARELSADPATGVAQGVYYAKDSGGVLLPFFRTENSGVVYPLDNARRIGYAEQASLFSTTSSTFVSTGLNVTVQAKTTGKLAVMSSVPCIVSTTSGVSTFGEARVLLTAGVVELQVATFGSVYGAVTPGNNSVYTHISFISEITVPLNTDRTFRFDIRVFNADSVSICPSDQKATLTVFELND